ncbi:1,6-anhydro-N-acetylmuramyl-L-alanine amidase AmpD [Colwellia sp. BRX8-9]|nr:1,6-anhydro-N-acetylmuramyl-L-alanine amidase AmpD [Colwellia sp. BRX8-9]
MPIISGWLVNEEQQKSPHFSVRDKNDTVHLLVVHNISLPPNQFGGSYITDFFLGKLDSKAHSYFEEIAQLKVSAHCLITRVGHIIQYVSFDDKAWHAGVSSYQGLDKCNDFSIGIELEGADDIPYEAAQYHTLAQLTQALQQCYPDIKSNIAGHSDIAPGRKTDPGDAFNWQHFHDCLKSS